MNTARIEDILGEALACPPDERARRLDEACGDDAQLRAEVESLLEAYEQAGVFMAAPSVEESTIRDSGSPREGPGTVIGRYRLLQLIGEGGFGSVFMAEQREPVHRRVAVKIIKLGMDTKQVIARFEAERQALAMMDHPNIAHVLDAGATEAGRPYFVMELVRGEPITEFCDRETLSIRHRLDLFRQVCSAVQHAHQKGIIHRDLKPSNILVGEIDGRPTPKIIDFGIAKATGGTGRILTDKTLFTDFRQFIGTPEYMSPEQAGKGAVDVDTRSDIYALGVLLYELVTGGPPFDPKELRSAAWEEMRRIIRENEPQWPSTRLHTREDTHVIAARRGAEPARLVGMVRGDIDWIVMKCLEKDRSRRYGTANALAADLGRYLAGEPVVAAPPSHVYRLRKFASRNRAPVAAGLAIALVLALGMIGTAGGLAWALAAEAEAHQRAIDLEQVAAFQESQLAGIDAAMMGVRLRRDIIERRRAALEFAGLDDAKVQQALSDMEQSLYGVNFTDVGLQSLDANIFERAASGVKEQFADQPLVEARLLQTLANTMRGLGLLERADKAQSQAVEIRRRELGDDHPDTLSSIHEAGVLLRARGMPAEAEAHIREAMEGRRRVLGDTHLDTLSSISAMRGLVRNPGDMDEAERYFREAMEGYRQALGDDHPTTLHAIRDLASLLGSRGHLEETEAYAREVLEGCRRVFGDDHPDTLRAIGTMSRVLEQQGRPVEAEPYIAEALEAFERLTPGARSDAIIAINSVIELLIREGRFDDVKPHYRWMVEHCRRTLGDDHPKTLVWVSRIGVLLRNQGLWAEAEPYLREAVDGRRRVLGDAHPHTLGSMMKFGILLRELGRSDEAAHYMLRAVEGSRRLRGDDHPRTLEWMAWAGAILRDLHRLDEAERVGREAAERARKAPPDTVHMANILSRYARTLRALERFEDAEAVLLEAHALCKGELGPAHERTGMAARQVAKLYGFWHEAEPDAGHDAKANPWWLRGGRVPPKPEVDGAERPDGTPGG